MEFLTPAFIFTVPTWPSLDLATPFSQRLSKVPSYRDAKTEGQTISGVSLNGQKK
jgi:hypothetical protein